jgi:hypothetical protein
VRGAYALQLVAGMDGLLRRCGGWSRPSPKAGKVSQMKDRSRRWWAVVRTWVGGWRGAFALAAVAGVAGASAPASGAEIVARWTFNGVGGTTSVSEGAGTASLVGGATQTFPIGSPTDKVTETELNRAWSIGSFPAQGTGSGTRGAMFQVAPPAESGITITWSQRHSSSASRWTRFEYTLDGTNFTSAGVPNDGLLEANTGGDQWIHDRSVDLSKVAGIGGNANFAFRIVTVFAPGTETYVPTGSVSNYSTAGTMRFDVVTVSAIHLPGPGTASLLGAAALTARGRSRTRRTM